MHIQAQPAQQRASGSTRRFVGMLVSLHLVRAASGALFRYLGGSSLSLPAFQLLDAASFLVAAVPLGYWIHQYGWSSVLGDRPMGRREKAGVGASLVTLLVLLLIGGLLNPASLAFNLKSALVVPVFEELLFRGIGWRQVQQRLGRHQGATWLVVALIFAFWHLGYADVLMAHPGVDNWGLVLLMKLPVALCYGLVTGWLRTRTGRLEWPLFLHMLLNLFGA